MTGIVRAARRPSGWRAPGPRPETPNGRVDLWPASGEDLCFLAGDWRILQRVRGHRWSLDDLVTAAVAADVVEAPRRIADLGCGIGAVLLLLAWRFPSARILGVEAQEESVALARRSIGWNGAEGRCDVRLGDLRDPDVLAGAAPFDLITGTPPYLPLGTGRAPTRSLQAGCHLEERGGVEAYCDAAARLLGDGSRLVLCHSSIDRTEAAARAAGLAVGAQLDVIPRAGKSRLFSVFRISASAVDGEAKWSRLVVRDAGGEWTPEFRGMRASMGMPS